jgi:hypothetical protein
MTLAQAYDLADLAAPTPHLAGHALRLMRQAVDDGEQSRQRLLEDITRVLISIRDAAGVPGNYALTDLPQAINSLRRNAFPERVTVAMCARAVELCPPEDRIAGINRYAMAWLAAWRQAVQEVQP